MAPARIFGELVSDSADSIDKAREAAEGATPAVSELKDQAMKLPDPVQKAGKKMDELKTKTVETTGAAGQLNAELSQAEIPTTATNQELQRQVALLEVAQQRQAAANGEKEVGAQIAEMQAQLEQLAAENAALLAANQASANAEINQGAAAASNLANQLQRAATAAASIGGGGGLRGGAAMGGTGYTGNGLTSGYNSGRDENFGIDLLGMGQKKAGNSGSKKYSVIDRYYIDKDGEIAYKDNQQFAEELKAQRRLDKVGQLNEQNKLAQAWDQSTTDRYGTRVFSPGAVWRNGGVIGPVGSENYNRFMQDYGGFLNRYAEGGYVTGPQQAVVGEGGEPEYIIPASKMDGAMQRYSAGMRGSSMIPSNADVTVNYSGSTVDMGGSSYINKGDVTGIVSQAVNQTLTKLQRSSKARLTAGLR
jgi:hypothetical protein